MTATTEHTKLTLAHLRAAHDQAVRDWALAPNNRAKYKRSLDITDAAVAYENALAEFTRACPERSRPAPPAETVEIRLGPISETGYDPTGTGDHLVRAMVDIMGCISQDNLHAGWATGIEHQIWDAVQGKDHHLGKLDGNTINVLRWLSAATDRWICWDWGHEPEERPIPLQEWRELHAKRKPEGG